MQNNTPLNVAMIRVKFDLKQKIKEIRAAMPVPPYVLNAILSEIQSELKDEEKETLTVMLMQAQAEKPEEGDGK